MISSIKKTFPPIVCSLICGTGVGGIIFLFKFFAEIMFYLSDKAYSAVSENWLLVLPLAAAAALLGAVAGFILKYEPDAAGGGIPSSVAMLRGIIEFRWLKNLISVFMSSMLTYVVGIPLGNEGPCVQLGTNVGRGAVEILDKKHSALDRYSMTGGASAGFAVATGAPICGILFALEEVHRKLTPTILVSSAVSVIAGFCTYNFLSLISSSHSVMFSIPEMPTLRVMSLWCALVVGVVCGVFALLFTKLHKTTSKLFEKVDALIPSPVKLAAVFVLCALVCVVLPNARGTGLNIAQAMLENAITIRIIIPILLVRTLLLIVSNNAGVTGGAFVPSLVIGGMLGAVCGRILVSFGVIGAGALPVIVALGMVSFLGAASKTPLIAITFGLEALGGISNVPAFVIAVISAYFVMELFGVTEFAEREIAKKEKCVRGEKETFVFTAETTVKEGSFAQGRTLEDLLLPHGCSAVSTKGGYFNAGDRVTLVCVTHSPEYVKAKLFDVFGDEISLVRRCEEDLKTVGKKT